MTEPTDAEIIALNAGEIHFSESPTKYPEAGHGTQYHAGAPGVLSFARAVLAKWGTPPAVVGEPVAWLSVDCIGERYLCFTRPDDSDSARPLVFGDTTPQPAQPQAGAVPLTDEQIDALDLPPSGTATVRDLVRIIEAAHGIGIKGGQHGTE